MCINKSTNRQLLLAYPCHNCFIWDHTNLKKKCNTFFIINIWTLFGQNAVYYAISFEINEYPPIAIQNGRIDIY